MTTETLGWGWGWGEGTFGLVPTATWPSHNWLDGQLKSATSLASFMETLPTPIPSPTLPTLTPKHLHSLTYSISGRAHCPMVQGPAGCKVARERS